MSRLFTYCIPYDDGAAPNPYWGVCTLVICKPRIRKAANLGDWIVGTGAIKSPIGDVSGQVVYAMKVTQKMSLEEYDIYTKSRLPNKIPDWRNKDKRKRLGDSIYDFSKGLPIQRRSVHNEYNITTDLSGRYALLSDHFYYFGNKPIPLPLELRDIVKQGQGHRSNQNAPYFDSFVEWLEGLGYKANTLLGEPQFDLFANEQNVSLCAKARCSEAEEDEFEVFC
jgi:hypothetical protein